MATAIVTDSTSYLPPELLAALVEPDRLVERHLAALEPAHDVLERLERLLEGHRSDIGAILVHALRCGGDARGGQAGPGD